MSSINLIYETIVEKGLFKLFDGLFNFLIKLIFVQIPSLPHLFLNGKDEKREKQKRIRAKLIERKDDSSIVYRAIEVLERLESEPENGIVSLGFIPDLCLKRYPTKQTMGVRQILDIQEEKQSNGKIFKKYLMGNYQFSTYEEICQRIDLIGKGILSLNCKFGENILIISETRSEWLLTAFAAFKHGLTLVTLLPTLNPDAMKHVINESKVKLIIASYDILSKLDKILNETKEVEHIIYFLPLAKPEDAKQPQTKHNIQFLSLNQLEEQAKNLFIDENLLKERPKKSDIAVIMYTSGSTGTPKGVLISHENILAAMSGQKERLFPIIDRDNDIYIAYLPLAHILELCCEILIFYMGVKCGYSSPQTLTDQSTSIRHGDKGDLKVLRPHIMTCVPTILDRMTKTINEKINKSNLFKRLLFNLTFKIKEKRLESGLESPILDQFIYSKINETILGGRVKGILCGGAVLSKETQRFIQTVLSLTIFQGYGLTETTAAGTIADQYDISVGRAGYPLISSEIRLINWNEGKYCITDKPNPRGEILIGGKIVAQGYYGQAIKENENFKEIDGTRYFFTGDIGQIFPDGTIQIIDRKKDLIKLRSGEYVSLTKVETSIQKLPFIENCCLCASSSAEFTVLLISTKSKENKTNEETLKEVEEICRKDGIQSYEIPQRIKIVEEQWTPDTGLVTDALKLKRKAIEEKYANDIKQLYQENSFSKSKLNDPIKKDQ